MTPRTLTVISGVVLLIVFLLAGWRVRHRRHHPAPGGRDDQAPR